jgi:hypothetical protein
MGFRSEEERQIAGGIIVASTDPRVFERQVREAHEQRDGKGSEANELDSSLLHELLGDVENAETALELAFCLDPTGTVESILRPTEATEEEKRQLGFPLPE